MRSLTLALAIMSGVTMGSRMSELDCGEGMMRDLDGACVKKFQLPTTKLECPKLSVDNGEIFLIGSGRMVRFYCDTGFTRVPDTEIAICQVMGTWSKTVPACLMAGCQAPPAPANGAVRLPSEFEDTVAEFSCSLGHVLTPASAAVLGCVDGEKWNGSVPECREVVSDQPDVITGVSAASGVSMVTRLAMVASLSLALRSL